MKHRIAVCALPRLAATVAGIVNVDRSVAVVVDDGHLQGGVRPVHRLVDASEHARKRGVMPGQRILEAQRFAPDLQIKVVAAEQLRAEVMAIAEVLLTLSPVVEPLLPAHRVALPCFAVAVDVTGLPRPAARVLSDLVRAVVTAGHRTTVALSSSKAMSWALAKDLAHRPGLHRRQMLEATTAMREGLLIDLLELDVDLVDSLKITGVRTIADLRPLLSQGLVTRLGAAAKPVLALLGDDDDTADSDGVVPWRPGEVVGASRDLDHPVSAVEPLLFVLRPLVETIIRRLVARDERLVELAILLGRRRRDPAVLSIAFPDATVDVAAVLRVLTARVEAFFVEHHEHVDRCEDHLLVDGVDRLTLVARRTATAKPRQLGLMHQADDAIPTAVSQLLAELTAEHGDGRVGVLTTTRSPLPEQMGVLGWPPPLPLDPESAPRRRRLRPVVTDLRTREGRFTAGWPWPLRLLPRPRSLSELDPLDVKEDTLFAVLEGNDARGAWRRHYRVLTLQDGRRALALVDDEAGEVFLQGWFD